MEWYVQWIQAYSAFANRNDYAAAISQLKQLEENPVCKNNLVSVLKMLFLKSNEHSVSKI